MSNVGNELTMFNGEIRHPGETRLSIQSDAVMYGAGIFETMRTYQQKFLPFLEAHLNRLNKSLAAVKIPCPYSKQQLGEMVSELVSEHPYALQRIKLVVNAEGVFIQSNSLVDESIQGVRLMSYEGKRSLAEHKTTSYLDCYLAWQHANEKGFDDALFVDTAGQVYESSRANLFWVKDGAIFTRQNEVLPGIMRGFVIDHCDDVIQYKNGTLNDLLDSDEVFITNSIKGILPVTRIDNCELNNHDKAKNFSDRLHDFVIKPV